MIRENTPLHRKVEPMGENQPFLLEPAGKDYLWGGTRLKDDFGKQIPLEILAETWECSTHPDGLSIVRSGIHTGKTLAQVLQENPQYLGSNHRETACQSDESQGGDGQLPILIKFIDARENLSIQVHPDDTYAGEHENGARGKTEMWYVLDAASEAELIYGLRWDMDKETLKKELQKGTVQKYLQKVKIKADDVFYLEAGTIHAIGAGALIAEIQENSNLTYRLYDYDRVDKQGKKRPLHVEKALDAANLKSSAKPVQPMRVLKYTRGFASELLCRCQYFQVERVLLNTECNPEMVSYHTGLHSFEVLLCIKGCGVLFFKDSTLTFGKGDCVFVPASSVQIKIHGNAQLLKVRC